MTNIFNLAAENKSLTYEELLIEHLNSLTEEQKNIKPVCLMLGGIAEIGALYSVLEGEDACQLIGALEVLKQHLFLDFSGG